MASALLLTVALPIVPTSASASSASAAPPPPPASPTVRLKLAELAIAPETNGEGYSRARFKHWITIGGTCDTREWVLVRDGQGVQTDSECKATSGTWTSAYDGAEITDAKALDIDHMVPLQEAWQSGAATWTSDRRQRFANDLSTPQLWAVTAKHNRAKGAKDPAQWRPPLESFACTYASAWIEVKHHYGLTVDQAEHDALERVVERC